MSLSQRPHLSFKLVQNKVDLELLRSSKVAVPSEDKQYQLNSLYIYIYVSKTDPLQAKHSYDVAKRVGV